jgi:hypothetical protein
MTAPEDRLEHLQETIDSARDKAEEANIIDDPDEPKFYESGDHPELDDQTIAPA